MTELEKFTADLRKLTRKAPSILLVLPPNDVGLPDGSFCLETFLLYVASCLDGKIEGTSS